MSISLQFYADAALTQPLGTTLVTLDREIGGPPVDRVLYLGSTQTGRHFEADGGGPITIGVSDGNPSDGGFVASDIVLAASQSGLDTATAGQPLSVGGIDGGVAAALPVWLRFVGSSATPKTSTDLALATNLIRETAV